MSKYNGFYISQEKWSKGLTFEGNFYLGKHHDSLTLTISTDTRSTITFSRDEALRLLKDLQNFLEKN